MKNPGKRSSNYLHSSYQTYVWGSFN